MAIILFLVLKIKYPRTMPQRYGAARECVALYIISWKLPSGTPSLYRNNIKYIKKKKKKGV
jgi:hypothetical protein